MLEGPSRSELRNAVPAREPETGIPFGFPRRDRERQDEVVVGPFAPVQGVFRTGLTHFEAEVDEFPGQKSRARRRSRDLEGPVWRRTCAEELTSGGAGKWNGAPGQAVPSRLRQCSFGRRMLRRAPMAGKPKGWDAIVIGSGIGGLTAAVL